jgi:hypothetical protein
MPIISIWVSRLRGPSWCTNIKARIEAYSPLNERGNVCPFMRMWQYYSMGLKIKAKVRKLSLILAFCHNRLSLARLNEITASITFIVGVSMISEKSLVSWLTF